ncbi:MULTISPECIES: alcohol dehydrogenase catalytic domain-containing protein [unclassified Rhodococcus (in: high G+C Gram-positive bacteria)]|uniref:alcohol dehydrogenase catalytic domain-containing protein n=1 Tax=unclassified Rhodococcus (in: high G+C Gram-positive bacteria) TaxID=192944 RepID=UPI0015C5D72C|nr:MULTISPECIES: zinc-binding dehydrogenase [unclassified Rhodococcus (in: high G+C Gram-positive bacteria)]
MHAVVMTGNGGPDVLSYRTVADPTPTPGQVVVRVLACGVCGHDVADRAGLTKVGAGVVLGHEIAGEVVATGAAVRGFTAGDLVAGKQHHTCRTCRECRSGDELACSEANFVYGGYAEYVALEQDVLMKVPDGVDMAAAAVSACAVGSCVQALEDVARVQPGETVVITGAGGGLGLHAMQIARHLGARVIAVTSSPAKSDLLTAYGADDVVVASAGIAEQVLELTGGAGAEVVLDNVGLANVFDGCFRSLRRRGRYVFTGQLEREKISLYPAFVFFKEAVVTGSASTTTASFRRALDLVAAGAVRPVTRTFALAQTDGAHRAIGNSDVVGRAVLVPF